MAFKMKGFPMQKGTGSYLKEESAARMKKEAMAKMKEEEGMKMKKEGTPAQQGIAGKQLSPEMVKFINEKNKDRKKKKDAKAEGGGGSKPDFLDLDGDGNKKESMKQAAKDKKARSAFTAKD